MIPIIIHSVFFCGMATVAIVGFLARVHYLTHNAKPHGLGRTAWIYWPTQISMIVAAVAIWTLAYQLFYMKDFPVVSAWSCTIMGVAWVSLPFFHCSDFVATKHIKR